VQLYIENSTDVMTQLNKLDGLKELKRPELVRQHLAEKGDEIRLAKYFTNVDKQLRKIRNMEKQLRAHEGLSDEMKKKQLRKYRDMKMSLMENANGLYKSMKDRD
jgi:seryl-tRNA synthetase